MTATLFESMESQAIDLLRDTCPKEGFYFADSGGKDSCVCLHLLKISGVPFDSHHHLTTVDPPELVQFVKRHHPETSIELPKKTMWQLIIENGVPPTRLMRYCCRELKEHGGASRIIVTGVRWAESTKRASRKQIESCHTRNAMFVHPIISWSDADVWTYIRENEIPYCSLYDEGFDRLGCIGCPNGGAKQQKIQFARWPKIRAQYMRTFSRMIDRLVAKGRDVQWKTPEDVMAWWLGDKKKNNIHPDQTRLFFEEPDDESEDIS